MLYPLAAVTISMESIFYRALWLHYTINAVS